MEKTPAESEPLIRAKDLEERELLRSPGPSEAVALEPRVLEPGVGEEADGARGIEETPEAASVGEEAAKMTESPPKESPAKPPVNRSWVEMLEEESPEQEEVRMRQEREESLRREREERLQLEQERLRRQREKQADLQKAESGEAVRELTPVPESRETQTPRPAVGDEAMEVDVAQESDEAAKELERYLRRSPEPRDAHPQPAVPVVAATTEAPAMEPADERAAARARGAIPRRLGLPKEAEPAQQQPQVLPAIQEVDQLPEPHREKMERRPANRPVVRVAPSPKRDEAKESFKCLPVPTIPMSGPMEWDEDVEAEGAAAPPRREEPAQPAIEATMPAARNKSHRRRKRRKSNPRYQWTVDDYFSPRMRSSSEETVHRPPNRHPSPSRQKRIQGNEWPALEGRGACPVQAPRRE